MTPRVNLNALAGIFPADVILELMNHAILGRNDPVDNVANRHQSNNRIAVHDRKEAAEHDRHALHALVNRGVRGHGANRGGRDVVDLHLARRPVLEHDLPGVIAFRKYPDELAAVHDDEGANVLVGHFQQSFVDGYVGRDGVNVTSLALKDALDRVAKLHGGPPPNEDWDEVYRSPGLRSAGEP